MKVTRVLLAANSDPIYYGFWNPLSQVYAEKFDVKPTLIWFGTEEEIESLNLSREWGGILVQEQIPTEHIGWQSAWSIFWFMSLYPEDIFLTMGIDQVPLSPSFLRNIPAPYSEDTYLMLADDGYLPSHWKKDFSTSPTALHICKGALASKIYGFESTFQSEIQKISESGIVPFYDHGSTKWGLDESYSSHKLRQYRDSGGKIESLSLFKSICDRRIECCRENEPVYNENLLTTGWYGDAHLCRPFSNHKNYIENLLKLIPKS